MVTQDELDGVLQRTARALSAALADEGERVLARCCPAGSVQTLDELGEVAACLLAEGGFPATLGESLRSYVVSRRDARNTPLPPSRR